MNTLLIQFRLVYGTWFLPLTSQEGNKYTTTSEKLRAYCRNIYTITHVLWFIQELSLSDAYLFFSIFFYLAHEKLKKSPHNWPKFFFSVQPKSSPNLNSCSIKIARRGNYVEWLCIEPVCLLVVIDHGKQSSCCETQSWQQCGECRILYYKYLLRSSIIGSRKVLPHIFLEHTLCTS